MNKRQRRAIARSRSTHSRAICALEALEQRLVFSTITVNAVGGMHLPDSVMELREAVLLMRNGGNANAALGRALTAGELAQIDTTEAFGTNDRIVFASAIAGQRIDPDDLLEVSTTLTIDGGAQGITLHGSGGDASRAFNVDAGGNLTLINLTLDDFGNAEDTGGPYTWSTGGGAILVSAGATLNLARCRIINNTGLGRLGIDEPPGSVETGGDGRGGAIYNNGGTVNIIDSSFENNRAFGGDAYGTGVGGQALGGDATGGAIYSAGGTLTISRSTFDGNRAIGGDGNITAASTIAVGGSGYGGAIYTSNSIVSIANCTFTNNSAVRGVAVEATSTTPGTSDGGAIYISNSTVTMDFATVSGNVSATSARNVAIAGGNVAINSSIIGQTDNAQVDVTNLSGTVSGANNLVRNTTVSMGVVSSADPLLDALADNGGPTKTLDLQAGSPAIDAGGATVLATDQRGYDRAVGTATDIGAVERAVLTTGVDPVITSTAGAGTDIIVKNADGSVKYTIANPFPDSVLPRRLASGDVTDDGTADIVVATGPGVRGRVAVFDGTDGTQLTELTPFDHFTGGIFVTSGDVNNDGFADVIVAAGNHGGPATIKVYSGQDFSQIADVWAFAVAGTVRIAAADLDGDGLAEVIATRGTGRLAKVRVFDGQALAANRTSIDSEFIAFSNYRGGCFVAAGDVDNDGQTDIIVAQGAGVRPWVSVFNGDDNTLQKQVRVPAFNGTTIACRDVNGDGYDDLLAVTASNDHNAVSAISGLDDAILETFDATGRFRLFIA